MLVQNEEGQLVDISAYAGELLVEGFGSEAVTEEDAQNALAEMFANANQIQAEKFFLNFNKEAEAMTIAKVNKGGLWQKIKEFFCKIVKEDSTFNKIIEFILEAIASVIPMGVFIKALVKKIVKFLLGEGIKKVCPAQ